MSGTYMIHAWYKGIVYMSGDEWDYISKCMFFGYIRICDEANDLEVMFILYMYVYVFILYFILYYTLQIGYPKPLPLPSLIYIYIYIYK